MSMNSEHTYLAENTVFTLTLSTVAEGCRELWVVVRVVVVVVGVGHDRDGRDA